LVALLREAKTLMNLIRCAVVALMLAPVAGAAQDFNAGQTAYDAGDYATALREWRPLAEQGDAWGQSNLGVMYELGQGVPQDYAEAVRWYRAAAEQGKAWAQSNLGAMYYNGRGVPQDYAEAHMWLNIAAANGAARANERRDVVAGQMTAAAVSEAQRRARACVNSGYQDCD